MSTSNDQISEAAIDAARATLPIYVVADSPDGDVLSREPGYPGDDTKVWLAKGGSDDDPTTIGDLYAEYGDDLIAYAEPEEYGMAASLAATQAGAARPVVLPSPAEVAAAANAAGFVGDTLDPIEVQIEQARVDKVADAAVTAAIGAPTEANIDTALTALTAQAQVYGYVDPPMGYPSAAETLGRFEQGLISAAKANDLLAPLVPMDMSRPHWHPGTGEQMTEVDDLGFGVAVNVVPGITAALGHEAIDRTEDLLTLAEDKLGITAAMRGTGVIPRQVQRMAVGENPDAQAEVVAAFEANYVDDVNEFIETVLGPPPAPNADHDEDAYQAIVREARIWHAHQTAGAVTASLEAAASNDTSITSDIGDIIADALT